MATDITDAPLRVARRIGADSALNTAAAPQALAGYKAEKGYFDAVLEASGSAARPGQRV